MRLGKSRKQLFGGYLIILVLLAMPQTEMKAQIFEVGFKGGAVLSWLRYDEKDFRNTIDVRPIPGYSAGPVLSFKVRDRFFLHTEYLFTAKGSNSRAAEDEVFKDRVRYYYIEVPVLYNVFFKGNLRLGGNREFKYYAGAGPLFSYWLGGKGKLYSQEFIQYELPPQEYKVRFGVRDEEGSILLSEVYVPKPRRLQLGFAVGGGILTEPTAKQRIMVDLRFEYGHSQLAKSDFADYLLPSDYDQSLRARNMSIRLSGIYLIELDSNKKARHKGKSNINRKLKRR